MVNLRATRDSQEPPSPGDIAITQTRRGHTIARRNTAREGLKPVWHHIGVIATFEDAAGFAAMIADRDGVRAWFHKGEDEFEILQDQHLICWIPESRPNR